VNRRSPFLPIAISLSLAGMVALVFSNVGGYPFVLYDDPL
jgi:hypothetical protein